MTEPKSTVDYKLVKKLREICVANKSKLLKGGKYRYIDNGSNILAVAHTDFVSPRVTLASTRGIYETYYTNNETNEVVTTYPKQWAYGTYTVKSVKIGEVTTEPEPPVEFFSEIVSEGGDPGVRCIALDDRLGVFVLLHCLPAMGINVDVLLTDDEEMGASTASLFKTDKKYNWIVEFDRRNLGAVMYDYRGDAGWREAAAKYFDIQYGSFSDICMLEDLGVSAINVAVGYSQEHSNSCHFLWRDLMAQLKAFKEFHQEYKDTAFTHTKSVQPIYSSRYDYGKYYRKNGSKVGSEVKVTSTHLSHLYDDKVYEEDDLVGVRVWEPTVEFCDNCGLSYNVDSYILWGQTTHLCEGCATELIDGQDIGFCDLCGSEGDMTYVPLPNESFAYLCNTCIDSILAGKRISKVRKEAVEKHVESLTKRSEETVEDITQVILNDGVDELPSGSGG